MASLRHHATIAPLRLLPRNLLSRLAGSLVSIPLPKRLRAPAMRGYAKIFGADLTEVEAPLGAFFDLPDIW